MRASRRRLGRTATWTIVVSRPLRDPCQPIGISADAASPLRLANQRNASRGPRRKTPASRHSTLSNALDMRPTSLTHEVTNAHRCSLRLDSGSPAVVKARGFVRPETLRRHLSVGLPLSEIRYVRKPRRLKTETSGIRDGEEVAHDVCRLSRDLCSQTQTSNADVTLVSDYCA